MFTSYHDEGRCFEETRNGTLRVVVVGGWLPRAIGGRLIVACATARAIAAAVAMMLSQPNLETVVVDQVAASVPLLRACGVRTLFYCHFPDKLLARRPTSSLLRVLKALYRLPFDAIEEACTGCAHTVFVNSEYTAEIYANAFPVLRAVRRVLNLRPPAVLHPAVDVVSNPALPWAAPSKRQDVHGEAAAEADLVLLSINRFEQKKDHRLAIEAFRHFRMETPELAARVKLILAGGYDERLVENVKCLQELRDLSRCYGLEAHIEFRCNVSNAERRDLFQLAAAVVYTPSHEHFGIVPLEAMAAARPVLAVNNGGPVESVRDGVTGWLRPATAHAFAEVYARVAQMATQQSDALRQMGSAAREHVEANFSREAFGAKLDAYLVQTKAGRLKAHAA